MATVSIKSHDYELTKILNSIEKSFHLDIWIYKSEIAFREMLECITKLQTAKQEIERNKLILDYEAYMISSITFLARCFLDQPSMHLKISDCTKDQDLINCFNELMSIRNHEFNHWQGYKSSIRFGYSFRIISPGKAEIAQTCHTSLDQDIGPWGDKYKINLLYEAIKMNIRLKRDKYLDKMRKRLSIDDVMRNTEIIWENGERAI